MELREASQDDFKAICHLMRELNPRDIEQNENEREAVFRSIIKDSKNYLFVGTISSEIVTTCYLNIIPNITWGGSPYAVIENVVTAEPYRRKGYARLCIEHAINRAFDMGCFKLILMSSQQNDKTRAFYKSVGLEQSKDGYVIYKNYV